MSTPSPETDPHSTIRPRRNPPSPVTLSSSEPTLRFPRPQGNRRLANWVSSSHPDIMLTTELQEDSSLLSDSAYELINNTDTESQDGFPSESVCSSDYPHSDVQSLTGTEHTNDETNDDHEETYVAEPDADATAEHIQADEDDDEDGAEDIDEEADKEDIQQSECFENPEATVPGPQTPVHSKIFEERVRASSIQYAEESLKLPSSSTPPNEEVFAEKKVTLFEAVHATWKEICQHCSGPLWERALYCVGTVAFASLMVFVGLRLAPSPPLQQAEPMPTVFVPIKHQVSVTSTSTVIINHTSTKTILVSEAKPTTATPLIAATHVSEKPEPKGICSAELYGPREILVRIPEGTKLAWLAKDSISINVSRSPGQDLIKAKFSSVDEGILIEIPKKEAYGTVNISVRTTRRPKVNETFSIDMGTGVFSQAMDAGKQLALDWANFLSKSTSRASPSKVEEAFRGAQKSFKGVAGQFRQNLDSVRRVRHEVRREANKLFSDLRNRHRDIKNNAQLSLLRAQISANLVWLKLQGKHEEHDIYLMKATAYVQKQVAALNKAREALSGEKAPGRVRGFSLWAQQ